jgi:hypothetical protein
MSHVLDEVNLTELLTMCRRNELYHVNRGWSREAIYEALDTGRQGDDRCRVQQKRELVQKHIEENRVALRTQLDCPGKCATCLCPEIVIQTRWFQYKDNIL